MQLGLMVLLATVAISCAPSGALYDTENHVLLVIHSMSPASFPFGDILTSGGTILDDTVDIEFTAFLKSPESFGAPFQPELQSITFDRYEVTYERTDGGTAVPRGFTRGLAGTVRLTEQGSEELEITAILGLVVAPNTQKAQPPLSYLIDPGFEPDTGFINIQVDAIMTFFGRTLSGDRVQVTGTIGINFANFGDSNP